MKTNNFIIKTLVICYNKYRSWCLWRNGIKTNACCKGHDDGFRLAYLSLIMDEHSNKLIQVACEYLYLQGDKAMVEFSNNRSGYNTFIIRMADESVKNDWLEFLHNFLNRKNEIPEVDTAIQTYAAYLLTFAGKTGLHCRYTIENDQMMFGYSYPGTVQIFDEQAPQLDSLIDSIAATKTFPLTPVICNEKSLEQFINIIFPGSYTKSGDTQK